jgi:hypothetical protein
MCRRFGTHCLFHCHGQVGKPAYDNGTDSFFPKMEQTVFSQDATDSVFPRWNRQCFPKMEETLFSQDATDSVFPRWNSQCFPKMQQTVFSQDGTVSVFPRWNRQCSPKMQQTVFSQDGTDSVSRKRRHIKFRRRGITQKKAYNNQNKTKVWKQDFFFRITQFNDRLTWRTARIAQSV